MRRGIPFVLAGCLSACIAAAGAQTAPPPAPVTILDVAWRHQLQLPPNTNRLTMAIGNHAVFVAAAEFPLTAYAIDDGHELWQAQSTSEVTPVIAGSAVITAHDTTLETVDEQTGRTLWHGAVPGGDGPLWVSANSQIVVAAKATDLRAWRLDGSSAWTLKTTAPISARPIAAGDAVIAAIDTPEILALDPASGAIKWRFRLPARARSLSVVGEDLLLNDTDGSVSVYRLTDVAAKRVWRWAHSPVQVIGDAAFDDKRIYVALIDNTLKAFDRRSGGQRWSHDLASRPVSGPQLFDKTLGVPLLAGDIAQALCTTGKRAGDGKTSDTALVPLNASVSSRAGIFVIATSGDATTSLIAWRPKR